MKNHGFTLALVRPGRTLENMVAFATEHAPQTAETERKNRARKFFLATPETRRGDRLRARHPRREKPDTATKTASGMSYYGFRFYNPGQGRFLNRDPMEEEGGLNLYAFVGNDPVNNWDYLGLKAYLVYRKLNIDGLRSTFPVTGHVYLAFDGDGMGERWNRAKQAMGHYGTEEITFSFHPYSVWADANPLESERDRKRGLYRRNRMGTFLTEGSSVLINDFTDRNAFLSYAETKEITDNECEQVRLLEVALESALMNNFGSPDPGRYDFADTNCAHWANLMIERAGITSPGLGRWNLGVGNRRSPLGAVGTGLTWIGRSIYDAVDFLRGNDT